MPAIVIAAFAKDFNSKESPLRDIAFQNNGFQFSEFHRSSPGYTVTSVGKADSRELLHSVYNP